MNKILITLAALLFMLACQKEQAPTFYLSDEVKRKFSFKPGSYWIYRDSISGREDSCYVFDVRTFITDDGSYKSPGPFYEAHGVALKQVPKDQTLKEELNWGMYFYKDWIRTGFSKKINGIEIASASFFEITYPIPQNLNRYPELKIGMNTFFNVDLFNNETRTRLSYYFKDTSGKTKSSVYFNDSVGFIKMSIYHKNVISNGDAKYEDTIKINQVWELQRYKIIK
jgi:hypothetical protein